LGLERRMGACHFTTSVVELRPAILAEATRRWHHSAMNLLLWILAYTLMVAGVIGTVVPLLPGTLLVWAGIVLGAWIDDFTRVGWGTLAVITILAIAAWVLDYVAGLLGAKKAGASRLAIVGAAAGMIAGLFMGFVGVLFMPLVGATIGEFIARRNQSGAVKVGIATWLGIILGLIAKVVIAFVMIGVFLAALAIAG